MAIQSIDPATGEVIRDYEEMDDATVDRAVERGHEAFGEWRRTAFAHRAERLRRAATLLRDGRDEHALLMAREMGKPLAEGRAEADKCAWVCDHYAEHAEEFLAPEPVELDVERSYVAYRPLGVVLAVMPWNFPFWQVFRFAAPGLMAGNVALLKHASNVPGCAEAIAAIFHEAGVPEEVFQNLPIPASRVERVIDDPRVRAVTLTGSVPAGRAVAAQAGERLKKTVLELGGSDPYVVLDDAPLEATVEACVTSRLINGGQSCIAAKRFIVTGRNVERFQELMAQRMAAKVMGDPADETTDIGPQAAKGLRDDLHDQVERSVAAGARCLLGGEVPDRPGFYYPPTVLTDVGPGMAAYEEEVFGPVAAIIPVADEEEALRVANDTEFGLGAAVFTADLERGEAIARDHLDAGCCFVNDFVKSDPRVPFGGVKSSGYGRELGRHGIREFVNVKTVVVDRIGQGAEAGS